MKCGIGESGDLGMFVAFLYIVFLMIGGIGLLVAVLVALMCRYIFRSNRIVAIVIGLIGLCVFVAIATWQTLQALAQLSQL
jgi:hypothetical protein